MYAVHVGQTRLIRYCLSAINNHCTSLFINWHIFGIFAKISVDVPVGRCRLGQKWHSNQFTLNLRFEHRTLIIDASIWI